MSKFNTANPNKSSIIKPLRVSLIRLVPGLVLLGVGAYSISHYSNKDYLFGKEILSECVEHAIVFDDPTLGLKYVLNKIRETEAINKPIPPLSELEERVYKTLTEGQPSKANIHEVSQELERIIHSYESPPERTTLNWIYAVSSFYILSGALLASSSLERAKRD